MTLDEHYTNRDWEGFARLFLAQYCKANDGEKLSLLRELLTKYRRQEVLKLTVHHL